MAPALESGHATRPPTTSRTIFAADPRLLRIEPAESNPDASVTLSTTQLRINQRIASRAVRQTNAPTERLDRRLSDGDLDPDAITPEKLVPTIVLTQALPAIPPADAHGPPTGGGQVGGNLQPRRAGPERWSAAPTTVPILDRPEGELGDSASEERSRIVRRHPRPRPVGAR